MITNRRRFRRHPGRQPLDTVKLITGFPPGGTSDTLCRRVAENLRGGTYTKSARSRTSRARAARSRSSR
jgi:tripartite-type tricarboxylate transporter receptor subunit TctC